MALEGLFAKYDRLVLFDTETTGLGFSRDEIIEFAAVVVEQKNGVPTVIEEYDELITLSPGGFVPANIVELTGITNEDIRERGIPKTRLCCDIARMIQGNTLLLAYNAHFDLSFLYYLLLRLCCRRNLIHSIVIHLRCSRIHQLYQMISQSM